MNFVKHNDKTTLVLNASWLPAGFFTAERAISVFMKGPFNARALDANFVVHDWSSWNAQEFRQDQYFGDDHPVIATAKSSFVVPTILITPSNRHDAFTAKKKHPSRRDLYAMYDGVCQYCLKHIPYAEATKEHVIPRTLGGSNEDFNIVLACKACNSEKSDTYPYYDCNGNSVKAKTLAAAHLSLLGLGVKMRPEWAQFMFKK